MIIGDLPSLSSSNSLASLERSAAHVLLSDKVDAAVAVTVAVPVAIDADANFSEVSVSAGTYCINLHASRMTLKGSQRPAVALSYIENKRILLVRYEVKNRVQ